MILVCCECLCLLGGDGAVATDDLCHDTSRGLDAQGRGSHVHEQHVLHLCVKGREGRAGVYHTSDDLTPRAVFMGRGFVLQIWAVKRKWMTGAWIKMARRIIVMTPPAVSMPKVRAVTSTRFRLR
jgi:hypothetical protein